MKSASAALDIANRTGSWVSGAVDAECVEASQLAKIKAAQDAFDCRSFMAIVPRF